MTRLQRDNAPLPMRNGVAPSYIWLQKGGWPTVLDFLAERFPDVGVDAWKDRMARGEVVDEIGEILTNTSRYFWGSRIFYYRELDNETPIPFEEKILFQDQHLLVVDKPHFLPVIPTGRFLHETLLVRLKNKLDLPDLSPIHRLDRETAGVMIFSTDPASRGAYQALFQQRSVVKEYQALAPHLSSYVAPFTYRSLMVPGTPFFRMQEIAGAPNSETQIEIIARYGDISRYRLLPRTGRKHQLRVHLAALGVPIINDAFYPIALPCKADDMSQPLKLQACSIRFTDPLTNQERCFASQLTLI
ncbi:tRNA pseudouridine32 synthase/23S rRNA pseudouridine746 synthase [Oxalobacteraceae bacterium GrIS 2.11]